MHEGFPASIPFFSNQFITESSRSSQSVFKHHDSLSVSHTKKESNSLAKDSKFVVSEVVDAGEKLLLVSH